jgi:putative FmdB family regulatory protein
MPLYEFVCEKCGNKFTWLLGMISDPTPPTCDRCGAAEARRKEVSRFVRTRSEDETLDSLADPDSIGDIDDPRTMRKWAKEVSKGIGEDLGDDFEEMIESEMEGDQSEDVDSAA